MRSARGGLHKCSSFESNDNVHEDPAVRHHRGLERVVQQGVGHTWKTGVALPALAAKGLPELGVELLRGPIGAPHRLPRLSAQQEPAASKEASATPLPWRLASDEHTTGIHGLSQRDPSNAMRPE